MKPGSFSARTDAASRPCGDVTTTTIAQTTATRRTAVSGLPVFSLVLFFFDCPSLCHFSHEEIFNVGQGNTKRGEKTTHVMHCHADTHSPPDHA